LKDMAEAMEKFFSEEVKGIVIAGPGEAKTWLENYLSDSVMKKIVDVVDASFEDEGIMERTEEIIEKERRKRRKKK